MLQDTVRRVVGQRFAAPLVICNDEHRFVIAEQLREIAVTPFAIALEPVGRNTAAAAAAVLRPTGSSAMANGVTAISRNCSAMTKRCSSLQITSGASKR